MTLPRGITGFNVPAGITQLDERTFVSDCWSAVASCRGRVEDRPQVLTGSPTSFVTRVLIFPGDEATVLINRYYPWVGFCRPFSPGSCSLEFLDHGRLAKTLTATGRYRILEKWELQQTITDDMCGELGRGERSEWKYYSSLYGRGQMRVGDVVFNFWD
jgi:hypothetical protein